jgi:hypothetical protein
MNVNYFNPNVQPWIGGDDGSKEDPVFRVFIFFSFSCMTFYCFFSVSITNKR